MASHKVLVQCSTTGLSPKARDWNLEFQAIYDADAFEPMRASNRVRLLESLEADFQAFACRIVQTIVESRMVEPPQPSSPAKQPDRDPPPAATAKELAHLGTPQDPMLLSGSRRGESSFEKDLPPPLNPPPLPPPRGSSNGRLQPSPSQALTDDTSNASSAGAPTELAGHANYFRVGNVLFRVWPHERQAKHLMHSLRMVLLANAPALHVPLTALVCYCGVYVTAQTLLPLSSTCRVVYSGDGMPDPTPFNAVVHAAVRTVTDTANCLVETVPGQDQLKLPGLEVVQGIDGRYYVTNAVGLLPRVYVDVDSAPIRRFESLTIVDVPATPSADRRHATEMGVVLLFRSITQIITLPDSQRQASLVAAMRRVGLNLAFLGFTAQLIPDEDSFTVEQRAAALGAVCVEMIARALKALLYAELTTMFMVRSIEPLRQPVSRILVPLMTNDEGVAKRALLPIIVRKFFASKKLPSDSPVRQALLATRTAKRRLILERLKALAGLTFDVSSAVAAAAAGAQQQQGGSGTSADDVFLPVVTMAPIVGRLSIIPKPASMMDEAQLKGIVCPPRLFSYGLPRVVSLHLALGSASEAQASANLVLADRKQRYGRDSVQYALATLLVGTAQIAAGHASTGVTLYHDALHCLYRSAAASPATTVGTSLYVISKSTSLGQLLLFQQKPAKAFAQFRKSAELLEELCESFSSEQPQQQQQQHQQAALTIGPHLALPFVNTIVGALECIISAADSASHLAFSPSSDAVSSDAASSPATSRPGSMKTLPVNNNNSNSNRGRVASSSSLVLSSDSSNGHSSRMQFARRSNGGRVTSELSRSSQATTPAAGGRGPSVQRWLLDAVDLMIRVVVPPDDGVYRVLSMLLELLSTPDSGLAPAEATRIAAALHEHAVTVSAAVYGRLSDEHAAALAAAALALSQESVDKNHERCEQLLSQVVEVEEGTHGRESTQVAGALNNLGSFLMMRQRYLEARAALSEASDIYDRVADPDVEPSRDVCRRNLHVMLMRVQVKAVVRIQCWFRRRSSSRRASAAAAAATAPREAPQSVAMEKTAPVRRKSSAAAPPAAATKATAKAKVSDTRKDSVKSAKTDPMSGSLHDSQKRAAATPRSPAAAGQASAGKQKQTSPRAAAKKETPEPSTKSGSVAPDSPSSTRQPQEQRHTPLSNSHSGRDVSLSDAPDASVAAAAQEPEGEPTEPQQQQQPSGLAESQPEASAAVQADKHASPQSSPTAAAAEEAPLGFMSVAAATNLLQRVGRAFCSRRRRPMLSPIPTGSPKKQRATPPASPKSFSSSLRADGGKQKQSSPRHLQSRRATPERSQAAVMLQAVIRARSAAYLCAYRRACGLARFVRGLFARLLVSRLRHTRARKRLVSAASRLGAEESTARAAIIVEERTASKACFEQLMVIRRLGRDERQRRLERQEFLRNIQTLKANVEDDEQALRHVIVNEATFGAAQLQRSIRERLRASQRSHQQQQQQQQQAATTGSPGVPVVGNTAGRPSSKQSPRGQQPSSRQQPPPTRQSHDGGTRAITLDECEPGASPAASGAHQRDAANDEDGNSAAVTMLPTSTTQPLYGRRASGVGTRRGTTASSQPPPAAPTYEGYVVDEALLALIREEAQLVALRTALARRRDALEDRVELVRAQRDEAQQSWVMPPPRVAGRGVNGGGGGVLSPLGAASATIGAPPRRAGGTTVRSAHGAKAGDVRSPVAKALDATSRSDDVVGSSSPRTAPCSSSHHVGLVPSKPPAVLGFHPRTARMSHTSASAAWPSPRGGGAGAGVASALPGMSAEAATARRRVAAADALRSLTLQAGVLGAPKPPPPVPSVHQPVTSNAAYLRPSHRSASTQPRST